METEGIRGLVSAELLQKIEDAILLGDVQEIDDILQLAEDDEDFPKAVRYGLEALRYFRAHYKTGGDMEPQALLQKRKATVMETAWSAELLDLVRQEGKIVAFGQAGRRP